MIRIHLRDNLSLHGCKGSSDAEKRFHPAETRGFFCLQGSRYIARGRDAGSDAPKGRPFSHIPVLHGTWASCLSLGATPQTSNVLYYASQSFGFRNTV
jgi:hypothetical protein